MPGFDPLDVPIFSWQDLASKLEPIRGKPIPRETLKYWRLKIGIFPEKKTKLYSQNDLNLLRRAVYFMQSGKTLTQLENLIKMEHAQNAK